MQVRLFKKNKKRCQPVTEKRLPSAAFFKTKLFDYDQYIRITHNLKIFFAFAGWPDIRWKKTGGGNE
jgi:hypothetical protein